MIWHATPRRREGAQIAGFALLMRLIVFLLASRIGHISLAQYTAKGDTSSYIANAAVMCHERSRDSLTEYDQRVFPGYPVMIAAVHLLGIPLSMSALLVTWFSAAGAAALAARIFDDARVGWAMTCLIPHYLINSSLGMSEAPLLLVICLALRASQNDQQVMSGIAFAVAGMIRPMACFALAGVVLALLQQRRGRGAVVLITAVVVAFAWQVALFQHWTGDALRGIHVYSQNPSAYGGQMITWPFHSLLTTPLRERASIGRIFYIYVHVLITLLACALIAERIVSSDRPDLRNSVAFPWLIGNTLFVLCIGSVWGFRHFPRFTIPAAPAMFWTLRKLLPREPRWWLPIGTACTALAIAGVIDSP